MAVFYILVLMFMLFTRAGAEDFALTERKSPKSKFNNSTLVLSINETAVAPDYRDTANGLGK